MNCKKEATLILAMISIVLAVILTSNLVYAATTADVAYITNRYADQNVLDVFDDLGLSVEIIKDSQVPSKNFNNYKIVFVDDARLRNTAKLLKTDKYKTVIMNNYYGTQFGLTDEDGISVMGATDPLKVRLSNTSSIVQVYTQAILGSTAIQYYYLDDLNKVQAQSVARTYIGNEVEFGDVIEYIPAGTRLQNGRTSQENICFFGIAKTEFWTPAARNMFEDCIAYVGNVCTQDSDCDDSNNYTEDICVNPGQVNSFCENNPIECITDSDCDDSNDWTIDTCNNPGTTDSFCTNEEVECFIDSDCGIDSDSSEFCIADDEVGVTRTTFTCNNPGTVDSFCTEDEEDVVIGECEDICSEGACVDIECFIDEECDDSDDYTEDSCNNPGTVDSFCSYEDIECHANIDCGIDSQTGDYCSEDGDVVYDTVTYICNNPGQVNSYCTSEEGTETEEICDELCVNGSCAGIECYEDVDCGINSDSSEFCIADDEVGVTRTTFTCNNPGTIDAFCSQDEEDVVVEACEDTCSEGACVDIECYEDVDCGVNSESDSFCVDDNVSVTETTYTCNNPGSADSYCSSEEEDVIVEQCNDICLNGACEEIECYTDPDCDDSDPRTYDQCANPGTIASFCRNDEVNCLSDLDCGFTGFTGSEFCTTNDIYKQYQNSTCLNPGTLESYCNIISSPVKIQECDDSDGTTVDSCRQIDEEVFCRHDIINCSEDSDCGEDSVSGEFCADDDVSVTETTYTCNNPGTIDAFCSSEEEDIVIEQCQDICINGECGEVECYEDVDCGIDSDSSEFCIEDDVTVTRTTFTCNNPGSADSYCSEDEEDVIIEACEDICSEGACVDIECYEDVDCGIDSQTGDYCSEDGDVVYDTVTYICNNPGQVNSYCTSEEGTETEEICGEDSCGEWGENFCLYDDVYRQRACTENACVIDACVENNFDENELVQVCENGCTNRVCNPPEEFCGDGVIQEQNGEECDDGNDNDNDSCKNDCTANVCGDGVINEGVEVCEIGESNICYEEGYSGEEFCNDTCTGFDVCIPNEFCGDGIVQEQAGEQCDDSNNDNDDGCSEICEVEETNEECVNVKFVGEITGVDNADSLHWSTNGGDTNNLGVSKINILNGEGVVRAFAHSVDSERITHREGRGLGIRGGDDNDELDGNRNEKFIVEFDEPRNIYGFEVRALFVDDSREGPEEGDVNFFLNGSFVQHIDLVGTGSEDNHGDGKLITDLSETPILTDKIVFYVDQKQDNLHNHEYSLAKIKVCEPLV